MKTNAMGRVGWVGGWVTIRKVMPLTSVFSWSVGQLVSWTECGKKENSLYYRAQNVMPEPTRIWHDTRTSEVLFYSIVRTFSHRWSPFTHFCGKFHFLFETMPLINNFLGWYKVILLLLPSTRPPFHLFFPSCASFFCQLHICLHVPPKSLCAL